MSAVEQTRVGIPAGTWKADPAHSRVAFEVAYAGIARFHGEAGDWEAVLVGGESPIFAGSARVEGIAVDDPDLKGHLLTPDFFDADRYPELRFESTAIEREDGLLRVKGCLTMRGVTRPVALEGTIAGPTTVPSGERVLGVRLEATIDRTEFGIGWNDELPEGGTFLADDVQLVAQLVLAAVS